jgi:hypothetical protein
MSRVAASVAATCGKVSDHMVLRAAGVFLNARPASSAAIPLPATSATIIADTSEKLSMMLWAKASGSMRNPVTMTKIGMKNA